MKTRSFLTAFRLACGVGLLSNPAQAALVGVTANTPTIAFGGSGIIDYVASTGIVTISGDPAQIFSTSPFLVSEILGTGTNDEQLVSISFQVNSSGAFVSGVTGDDLVVKGWIDVDGDGTVNAGDYDGILLTGEVTHFGFMNGAGSAADKFDLRITVTGGALAPLYSGSNLGVIVDSEVSTEYPNPFNGSWSTDFVAQAKGIIGKDVPSGPCHVKLSAYCSVNGGPLQEKCRIKVTRAPEHWERCEYSWNGHTYKRSEYGMHGDPVPPWAANYPSTAVTFTYVLENDGNVDANNIVLQDSFDTPLTGVPSSLAPGATATVTRTVNLREEMKNHVQLCASNGSNECGAHDVVVIKDKMRKKRRFDDDDFDGKHNHH